MQVNLDDWIPQQLYFLGSYEDKESNFVSKTPSDGDTFIDIGANIGIFTMVASKIVGANGKVYAFEPLLFNFEKLCRHVSDNNLQNVVAERLPVLHENERIRLFTNDRWNNYSMATAYPTTFDHEKVVEGVSLDNYFHDHGVHRLKLIKIDIEGGESQALFGMENILRAHHPKILAEINGEILKRTPFNERSLEAFLAKLGYTKKYIDDSGNLIDEKSASDVSCNCVFI